MNTPAPTPSDAPPWRGPWMQTECGAKFHIYRPDPADVRISDLQWALAKLCRFNGHTVDFYSVAQHSCLVMDLVPPAAKPYALLHDAHEAYVGDLVQPVKNGLSAQARFEWDEMVARIDAAIHTAFGLDWPVHPNIARLVHEADLVALATERRDILSPGPAWEIALPSPAPLPRLRGLGWLDAAQMFHKKFTDCVRLHPVMDRAMRAQALKNERAGR